MKKIIVINFLAAFMFAACSLSPKSYIVEGVVSDDSYNNRMVYLYDHEIRERVDSALVVDGKFTFTGSVENAVIRRLVLNRLTVDFILENGKISVDMATPESVKGAKLNDKLSTFLTEMAMYQNEFHAKTEEIQQSQSSDVDRLRRENYQHYNKLIESLRIKVFNDNKDNILGAFVLWYNQLFDMEPDLLASLYAQAGDAVRSFKPLQSIIETNERKKLTAEGMPFTDFTIENGNIDGSKASLSDYVGKGKYVLVDFWASWCGPCIAEIPVLKEVYTEHRGDRFEILGVAVWENREATMKYIENNGSPWPQIIDAGDFPTTLYAIEGIPHIILFGPDGTIVARGLRGARLKSKVADVLCDCH